MGCGVYGESRYAQSPLPDVWFDWLPEIRPGTAEYEAISMFVDGRSVNTHLRTASTVLIRIVCCSVMVFGFSTILLLIWWQSLRKLAEVGWIEGVLLFCDAIL